jgi:hypothetical protein
MEHPCHTPWLILSIQKSPQHPLILVNPSILIWNVINLLHPYRVVDSLGSHDFLDTKFPSEEAIPKVMDFIDKPRKDEHHQNPSSLIWN